MSLRITIRTADRTPGPNYLGETLRSLQAAGVDLTSVHVFPTDPDVAWTVQELGAAAPVLHVPATRRNPNQNGVAQVSALDLAPADWLLMLEDDVHVCADFEGSVLRWLAKHQKPSIHVYRFCAFSAPTKVRAETMTYLLREQRGSQAVALRAEEARDFATWASEHHTCWRPAMAPFQNQRTNGFDKLVGYWALDRWPADQVGLVSRPMFVRHIGEKSLLHERTVVNTAWAGQGWRYEGDDACQA